MRRTKYMMSWGLAFAEKRDIEKLNQKAKQGWRLKSIAYAGFLLEKSEPEDVQYSIDYRLLKDGEKAEYLDLFAFAGWGHVCSSYDVHIFKAKPGTTPIYSDTESAVDKIDRLLNPVFKISKFIFPITILFILMMNLFNGPIQQFSQVAYCVSMVFATPTLMMLVALFYRKRKISISKEF